LPGVPLELKSIFTEELEPEFLGGGSAATVRELRFTFAVEARFYPLMRELEEKFPDVSVGSYPNFETKELVIRCLGSDPKRVDAHEFAAMVGGDDIAIRAAIAPVLGGTQREFASQVMPEVGKGHGPLRRARLLAGMLSGGQRHAREGVRAGCELAENLAARIG